ncbi:MAG: DUF456 domain-containing protein [Proteobacteria bacterium]|nr:DUF456 domain-containing protein [Pseudomonadota bacterium]
MEQSLIILITVLLLSAGLIGSVLPMLPGSPLILLGAFIYAWYTDFTVITWGVLLVLVALTLLLSQMVEYLATISGAKKYGASRWGVAGAVAGGLIGLFAGGVLGIMAGPFLGALVCELLYGRTIGTSMKIGFGTLVGFIGGAIGKLIIALAMVGVFLGVLIS